MCVCRLVTQPADHEKNTWVSTWTDEHLVEIQGLAEQSSNKQRCVTQDVTNSRSANQRRNNDRHWTVDNEKEVKEQTYSWLKEAGTKSGPTAGKDQRTDQEVELVNKNLITAEVPQRTSSRLANDLGSHDECDKHTA